MFISIGRGSRWHMRNEIKSWPRDYSACQGKNCARKEKCARYHGHLLSLSSNRDYQDYVLPDPDNCDLFIEINLENDK